MMGHKHLHELLREDQEPFQLKNYIADRRCQLKSTRTTTPAAAGKTVLQLTRRKPIIESTPSTTTCNFCVNHVCLFAFQNSPDVRKSPFIDFQSPATKSPCNNNSANNAAVFLNVPARTAAMLLDAAMRIQKQSTSKFKPDPSKNIGFGLFGSFLKRLKDRSTRTRRPEIGSVNVTPSSLLTRRIRDKEAGNDVVAGFEVNGRAHQRRFPRSGNNSRLSSADWSEKSSEPETSCSSVSVRDSYEIESVGLQCNKCFCSSPSSPFRFSLQRSPSPGRRTPDFLSPVTSPGRCFQQKENYEAENSREANVEEEEQCSPVSVLEPPFEDDEDEEEHERDGYDLECSYASVQRTKHQLLRKLSRFERLAGLDPIALEKHMSEQCDKDDDNDEDLVADKEKDEEFLGDILNHLGVEKTPLHIKRLVSDLIAEENKNEHGEHEVVVKRVCRRLDSWRMVESNTIDMMVEFELRREKSEGWKRYDEEKVREIGMNIEAAIFGWLVEELAQELVTSFGN